MTYRDHAKVAASLLLQERGYADSEINHGLSFYKDGIKFTKSSIRQLTNGAEIFIKIQQDNHYVGTSFYRGLAYFWAYKYRFCMRVMVTKANLYNKSGAPYTRNSWMKGWP